MLEDNLYGLADIQSALLDVMKDFHIFCVENEIRYSLCGGTCLGAVRHQGFIPWDDDLDVCMNRKNYNKLMTLIGKSEDLKIVRSIWIDRIQRKNAEAVRGYIPEIDVFVIDNAPDGKLQRRIKLLLLAAFQGMLKEEVNYKEKSVFYKILLFSTHMMGKLFSKEKLWNIYKKISQIGNRYRTRNKHCTNSFYKGIFDIYPNDTWDKIELVDFEDTQFFNTTNYDNYLKICYGEYMVLPEEKERRPVHIAGL
jgi:lipopolysaccharide cholinephosphotransferase